MCALPSSRSENKLNIIVDMKAIYPETTRGNAVKEANKTDCLDHNCNVGVLEGQKIRRLTEIECERLQGFPDGWTEGIPSSQRYKCLGNAVTVNVVEAIISNLIRRKP